MQAATTQARARHLRWLSVASHRTLVLNNMQPSNDDPLHDAHASAPAISLLRRSAKTLSHEVAG